MPLTREELKKRQEQINAEAANNLLSKGIKTVGQDIADVRKLREEERLRAKGGGFIKPDASIVPDAVTVSGKPDNRMGFYSESKVAYPAGMSAVLEGVSDPSDVTKSHFGNNLTIVPDVAKKAPQVKVADVGNAPKADIVPDFGYPENVGFVLQGSQDHTSAPGVSEEDIGKFVKASDKHTKWYFDQQDKGGKGTIVPDIIRGDVGDRSRAFSDASRMKILNDVDLVKAEEEWDRRVGPTSYQASIRPGASRAERVAIIQAGAERERAKDAYLSSLKGADAGDLGSFATSMGNVATNRMQAETAQAKEAGELSLIPSKMALGKAQIGHLGAQSEKERAEAKKAKAEIGDTAKFPPALVAASMVESVDIDGNKTKVIDWDIFNQLAPTYGVPTVTQKTKGLGKIPQY